MKSLMESWRGKLKEADNRARRLAVQYNTILAEDLFSLDEGRDEEKSAEAIRKIKAGEWEAASASAFAASLTCEGADSDSCHNKHPEMTAGYGTSELAKMDLYKVKGMNIGFALKEKDGRRQEIVTVHNNEPGVGGVGKLLMETAIATGGCFLDHYATPALDNLYASMGFEEYERWDFDPQYVSDEFVKKYGETDVVLRKHKSC
jgi:hypothetical protein